MKILEVIRKQMRNLVIIHLESLSNFIYNMNKDCFPSLNRWAAFMDSYSNYYSSATSTQMVISDLFMGRTDIFEQATYLECLYEIQPTEASILVALRNKGYITKYYDFGNGESEKALIEKFHNCIDKNGELFFGVNRQIFSRDITRFVKENASNSFAVFVKDVSSHLGSEADDFDKKKLEPEKWFKEKYIAIDKTVGMVFDTLKKNNVLDKTVVLLYGDHGDEPYFHSFHKGYFHAIEPFCDIIHCPLFIYDGGSKAENHNEIISTEDLRQIIEGRLLGESEKVNRHYAFSRNLFAAQRKMEDVFNKAYGITDGEYTLIITKRGMELYANRIDPINLNNLLDFYKIRNGRLVYNKIFNNVCSGHFNNFMSDIQKHEIEEKFYELRTALLEKINEQVYLINKFPFDKINYRMSKEDMRSCKGTLKDKIYRGIVAFKGI